MKAGLAYQKFLIPLGFPELYDLVLAEPQSDADLEVRRIDMTD